MLIGADVPAPAATRAVIDDAWQRLNEHWWRVTSTSPPWSARLTVRTAFSLSAQVAATSTPGTIEVRPPSSSSSSSLSAPAALSADQALALRHEVVHQHLWATCPQAGRDRLFHEAVAVALSGEAAAWDSERYQTLPQTVAALRTSALDTGIGRRALARLLREGSTSTGPMMVPAALQAGLRACADHAAWQPLTIEALVGLSAVPTTDALVVLHRASGAILEQRGDVHLPLPFGSTLKPFLFAAALDRGARLPNLPRRPTEPTWACGASSSATMTPTQALQLSCNGWFLDWVTRDTHALELGPWGTLLTSLGLSALPTEMSEAIGARASLRMPTAGLAEAFRVLSYVPARHGFDVVATLRGRGTLKDADHVDGLEGMAAKTGTVRDEVSRAVLGWLVAFDDDIVIVRVRAGIPARGLVAEVAAARARWSSRSHQTVHVQTFGLLPPADVRVRCPLAASVSSSATLRVSRAVDRPLAELVDADRVALCLTSSWSVPIGGESRAYAGVFAWSPPPPLAKLPLTTPRQQAARVGSHFVFSTSRDAYVRAVLDAEDSSIRGEARVALARVIDHNVDAADSRHVGRPACDTTHCQTFLGTRHRSDDGRLGEALDKPLPWRGWLPFSQGGSTPWSESRTSAEVRAAVGDFMSMKISAGVIAVVRPQHDQDASWDDVDTVSCELLRGRLRLPSCPAAVVVGADRFIFNGVGAGHGLGLDVERAKRTSAAGVAADAILRQAYGAP